MMVALYRNRITLLVGVVATFSLSAMVRPPRPPKVSWNSLPADVKRYAMQFIASSNVYEVAETMKALNATDRACNRLMQTEQTVVMIMRRMPYIANCISLLERLMRWAVRPTLQGNKIHLWVHLSNGQELLDATRMNNIERVKELLAQKDLHLDCWADHIVGNSLELAIVHRNHQIAAALIKAGAFSTGHALIGAVIWGNVRLVALLLEYGADPNIRLYTGDNRSKLGTPEARKIIRQAQEKRKQRMRLLSGKKPDGCVIA